MEQNAAQMNPARLRDYMAEVRPTVFPSLPRFFEKVHARVVSGIEQAAPEERKRFDEVLQSGRDISRLRQQRQAIPRIYADGFLKITGCKKEFIITSTGKNVAPAMIENFIKESHLVSHAMLYGDGRSYLVALITLDRIEAEQYARRHAIAYEDSADLTRRPEIEKLVRRIVDKVDARISSTEAIKRFAILDRDVGVEADEVTPTMKIKRSVVAKRYAHILEGLYV